MQQNIAQDIKTNPVPTDDEGPIQLNVRLDDAEAARFRRYKAAQKIKPIAAAAYKLMMERLEQWEKEEAA